MVVSFGSFAQLSREGTDKQVNKYHYRLMSLSTNWETLSVFSQQTQGRIQEGVEWVASHPPLWSLKLRKETKLSLSRFFFSLRTPSLLWFRFYIHRLKTALTFRTKRSRLLLQNKLVAQVWLILVDWEISLPSLRWICRTCLEIVSVKVLTRKMFCSFSPHIRRFIIAPK